MQEDFELEIEDNVNFVSDDEDFKQANAVVSFVHSNYNRAKDKKRTDETRFLTSYNNYRGIYTPEGTFRDEEVSKVFVKVTKTKVLAAYGQLVEVLFGGNKFPVSIEPRKFPEDIDDKVHVNLDDNVNSNEQAKTALQSPFGTVDGPELPPGFREGQSQPALGPLEDKLAPISDKVVKGPGTTPTSVTFSPAEMAAEKMEQKIHDQLAESQANKQLRSAAFEMALFGTGIIKGPMVYDKEYPNWDEEGNYAPIVKTIPKVSHVSVWNFYPDPDALNMEDAEFVVERHKMSRTQMESLKKRPFFRRSSIDSAVLDGYNYHKEYWESSMEDGNDSPSHDRYEVLEYWGTIPTELLEEYDIDVTEEMEDTGFASVNIWVCNGEVLRFVVNPFMPTRIPYYATPYEMNPYSFFGVGIAENMEDTQLLMNGFMRLAVDNAALSGNLVFEIGEDDFTPGQDLEIYPGKVFRRHSGAPGQSLFGTKFPNVSQENMMMFDKARLLADESTGFPSYAHGQTNVQAGIGRTASGISMLMNAATGGIRTVIKNVDDYLLGPLGKGLFAFNMQFNYDKELKGDLEVVAKGTESLMANEVRSQRLLQFLGVVSNPVLAPFAKMDVIVKEIAKSLDLDPENVVNSIADAAVQAEILKGMGGEPQPESLPAGTNPQDPTGSGGGVIGTGLAPTPNEPGFSANTGEGQQ